MRVDFHPAALREVENAQAWYETRSLLAASAFLREFSIAIQRIRQAPDRYFDPATLHDWPEVEAEFIEMAQSWGHGLKTATD